MQTFYAIVPLLTGLLVMVNVLTLPAALVFFILSFTSNIEEKRKEYRKISKYLFIPLWLFIFVLILFGIISLVQNM